MGSKARFARAAGEKAVAQNAIGPLLFLPFLSIHRFRDWRRSEEGRGLPRALPFAFSYARRRREKVGKNSVETERTARKTRRLLTPRNSAALYASLPSEPRPLCVAPRRLGCHAAAVSCTAPAPARSTPRRQCCRPRSHPPLLAVGGRDRVRQERGVIRGGAAALQPGHRDAPERHRAPGRPPGQEEKACIKRRSIERNVQLLMDDWPLIPGLLLAIGVGRGLRSSTRGIQKEGRRMLVPAAAFSPRVSFVWGFGLLACLLFSGSDNTKALS